MITRKHFASITIVTIICIYSFIPLQMIKAGNSDSAKLFLESTTSATVNNNANHDILTGQFESSSTIQPSETPSVAPTGSTPDEGFHTSLPPSATEDAQLSKTQSFMTMTETTSAEPTKLTPASTYTQSSSEMVTIIVKVVPRMTSKLLTGNLEDYIILPDPILSEIGVSVIRAPKSQLTKILSDLNNQNNVIYAEVDKQVQALGTIPNDPDTYLQYGLFAIHAPEAWNFPQNARVTIAILDTGIDYSHPEFTGKLVPGYDFINDDNIAQDDNGHGTHVAGIAAATGNNGMGISGVSWNALILPVKVLNSSGNGTYSDVARGIIWAVDEGADIINLSLGGDKPSQLLEEATTYASDRGVVLVASSGNSGANHILFPAAISQVIAVGAVDIDNNHAGFSNYGPELDLVAPGVNILSTMLNNSYSYKSGTSMSAPMIAGAIALLRSISGVSVYQAVYGLESSALDLGYPGFDSVYGYGLIQLDAAVFHAFPSSTPIPTDTPTLIPTSTATITPTFTSTIKPSNFSNNRNIGIIEQATVTIESSIVTTSANHSPELIFRPVENQDPNSEDEVTALGNLLELNHQDSNKIDTNSKYGRVCWGFVLIFCGIIIFTKRYWLAGIYYSHIRK